VCGRWPCGGQAAARSSNASRGQRAGKCNVESDHAVEHITEGLSSWVGVYIGGFMLSVPWCTSATVLNVSSGEVTAVLLR
jgi:hypothetical protein